MTIIYPEDDLSNKRLSERRSAVVTPIRVSRILCTECFLVNNVKNCILCKKPFCSKCLKNNQCEECYNKHNTYLSCLYKCFCKSK